MLEDLDTRIARLGNLAWELGPGIREENALTITPDGRPEWLAISQRVVAMAPPIPAWEFHPARPPKNWELQFSFEGRDGKFHDVDAREWSYVLFFRRDAKFDIVVAGNDLIDMSEVDQHLAAVIVLDGILGEARRLLTIGAIETAVRLPPDQAPRANSVTVLSAHLDSLK